MEKEIVAGALFLLALISPTPTPPAQTSQTKQEEMKVYAVQKEDTLGSIAKIHYGSENYWTNIWNDNSWIENPDIIEKDWKLNIKEKTEKPAELKKELSEKTAQKLIAYVSQAKVSIQAQIEPTQPQVAVNTNPDTKATSTLSTGPLNEAQITFLGNCDQA